MTGGFSDRRELEQYLVREAAYIRKRVLELARIAGGGHVGGGLSMIDFVVALYHHVLNIDPLDPEQADRDRFILSKGHGAIALDPILARVGFFPEEGLTTFNQPGSPFGMHTNAKSTPGIEHSTGSLGHGLPVAVGLALGARMDHAPWRVFCVVGDGEFQEGSMWEAMMSAAHFKLGNLVIIVDRNRLSLDGPTEEVMALEPFRDKLAAFRWNVREINGHNMAEILAAFDALPAPDSEVPTVIIANTVKGCGVSFMSGDPTWHYGSLDDDLARRAFADLDAHLPG